MFNLRLCKTAQLISFLKSQDFLSFAKEIQTPRGHHQKVFDGITSKFGLNSARQVFFEGLFATLLKAVVTFYIVIAFIEYFSDPELANKVEAQVAEMNNRLKRTNRP